jgi:ABC-type bacteriocin/lantibiotic exporter with double-glycine peptidase domain
MGYGGFGAFGMVFMLLYLGAVIYFFVLMTQIASSLKRIAGVLERDARTKQPES